jgi:hypothetical protein
LRFEYSLSHLYFILYRKLVLAKRDSFPELLDHVTQLTGADGAGNLELPELGSLLI